jgi:hypothetical protein
MLHITWCISICASLACWVLAFEFYMSGSPTNRTLDKLDRSNLFQLCDRFHNHLSILQVRNLSRVISDGMRSGQSSNFSRTRESVPWNDAETSGTVSWRGLSTSNCLILDWQATARSLRSARWFSSRKICSRSSRCRILATLDKSPFGSTRSIAEIVPVSHATMLQHFHQFSGFKSFYLL